LPVPNVRFAMFCAVPVPSRYELFRYLEFNELSSLPPVFVSAALETAVLLPKFIRACPNALLQRMRFQVKPPCFDGRFRLASAPGRAVVAKATGTGSPDGTPCLDRST